MLKRIAQKLRAANPRHGALFGPAASGADRIRVEQGEILSQMDCEGILFFMHPSLEWEGGLNRSILEIAGAGFDEHILDAARSPKSGDVFAIPPFQSGYKAIFMAVLADWDGGNGFEERDLLNCYRRTLGLSQEMGLKTLAIPALGRDKRDFPHIRFARIAVQGILEALDGRTSFVKIMCIDRTMADAYRTQLAKISRK